MWNVMRFNLASLNIGDLIRYKDELLKRNKITQTEYDVITKYLNSIICQEE